MKVAQELICPGGGGGGMANLPDLDIGMKCP